MREMKGVFEDGADKLMGILVPVLLGHMLGDNAGARVCGRGRANRLVKSVQRRRRITL